MCRGPGCGDGDSADVHPTSVPASNVPALSSLLSRQQIMAELVKFTRHHTSLLLDLLGELDPVSFAGLGGASGGLEVTVRPRPRVLSCAELALLRLDAPVTTAAVAYFSESRVGGLVVTCWTANRGLSHHTHTPASPHLHRVPDERRTESARSRSCAAVGILRVAFRSARGAIQVGQSPRPVWPAEC